MGQRKVVVVAGGERAQVPVRLDDAMLVIAADSGVDFAHDLGLRVDVAVGDFDSVSPAGLARVSDEGGRIERHPVAKDATDLELALTYAVDAGATHVLVIGVGGGRLDHLMANVLVLAAPQYASCRITAYAGTARAHVVRGGHGPTELHGERGELLTLLPIGGTASGITTTGLQYPLQDESLAPGTTRGVSNVVVAPPATVQLDIGTLLAVLPGHNEGVKDA